MKHFIWGVFMYTTLYSSIANGQHHNRTEARACGDCHPEHCPIPRQCLAGKLLSMNNENVKCSIFNLLEQVYMTADFNKLMF